MGASSTSSWSTLAGPAAVQPCDPTIRLRPTKGWPRSVPTRAAHTTVKPLLCAPPMVSACAITGPSSVCPGIGTQLVGTATMSAPRTASSR
ncbi:hypothetical protein G6F55_014248 [Rhizopus delemar]|nr:hypothetical protein G6F55_014248 [Rhizopus delemar]